MLDKLVYKSFGLLDKFIIASGKIFFSRSKSDKKKKINKGKKPNVT